MSLGFGDLSFCGENFGVKIKLLFLYNSIERTLNWRPMSLMPGQDRFSVDKNSIFTSTVAL